MNSRTKIIDENCVLLNVEAINDIEILSRLSDRLYENGYVKETYKDAVIERENNFPTGLPLKSIGVAIPHTDAHHVSQTTIGVAILKRPVAFSVMGSPNEKVNVSIILMLAMNDANKQIELLQKLMDFFQNEEGLRILQEMESEKDIAFYLEKQLF
jgi:galactitol PTS system EIIA component